MATTTTKCPICGSENVTPSHLKGFEKLLRFISPSTPYRCKECWSRFRIGGPLIGPMVKILAGVVILLVAVFFILPIDQFRGDKDKEDRSSKTVSKTIDKSSQDTSEKTGKSETVPSSSEDSETDEDDEDSPAAEKDRASAQKDALKIEDLGGVAKTAKKSDTSAASEEEDTEGPQAPLLPKLKEPNVEVPKGGKTLPKSIAKTADPKAEAKIGKKAEEPKKEIDSAENAEEKASEPPTGTVRRMKSIRADSSDNTVEVIVSADGPIREYKNFFLLKENPPKLVVDVKGKWKYGGKYAMDVNSDLVAKIRVAEHNEKGFFRIVMDLKVKEGMTPVFKEDTKGLVIIVKK